MVNLYAAIKDSNMFPKIEVNELLFAEYTCMEDAHRFGVWSDSNYFAFVSSGKKMWRSIYHSYEAVAGDILFIKKGANLTHQFFDEGFCAIFIFIPDEFIKDFLSRNMSLLAGPKETCSHDAVLRVHRDELLETYHRSILSYFTFDEKPNEYLMKLKFEELLLSLFFNEKQRHLASYFVSLCQSREHQMTAVMEENFAYNLTLDNYARLCNMSLSAFKKSFKQYYNTTPGNWIKERKLQLATNKLLNAALSVSQVSFDCGFEDTSHFIRVFKQKHGITPLQYRQQHATIAMEQD